MANKAIVVGGSGLIGRKLLAILYDYPEYNEIVSLGRKKIHIKNKKLTQVIIDFDHLENYTDLIKGHAVFCCLGSTKFKTPNLNDYHKVDHDYPLKLAEMAKLNGIQQYHLVSSIGANKEASNFYTKMKGETEEDIKLVGLNCLHIYQPSALTGKRNDRRLLETIVLGFMKIINPFLLGKLKKYRSISAFTVAMAMFKQSLINKPGVFIHPSDTIKQLA
jgi:uncharacterized protein YbjT (DUF2867 family)